MRTRHGRTALGATGAAILAASIAGPVLAAAPAASSWSDSYVVTHECGIVEATTVTVRELAFFEDGTWLRSRMHFVFEGVFTGPTGKSYASTSHQAGTFTPTTGATSGQGMFLRGAGGVLFMDSGRLVFELEAGETLHASAKVLAWDDPSNPGALEAALCQRLA